MRADPETEHTDASLADWNGGISLDTRPGVGSATIRDRLDRDHAVAGNTVRQG